MTHSWPSRICSIRQPPLTSMPLTVPRLNSPTATPAYAHRLAVTLAAIGLSCVLIVPSSAHAFGGSVKAQLSSGGTAIAPTTTYAPTTSNTQPGLATQTSSGSPTTSTTTSGVTHSAPARESSHSSGTSTPAIALAVLAALLALACAAWALARITAYEPRWLSSACHALAEGSFRVSATWAEFTDWARLGK
jgi:hypothetical protein